MTAMRYSVAVDRLHAIAEACTRLGRATHGYLDLLAARRHPGRGRHLR
jgi:hypothetical protein